MVGRTAALFVFIVAGCAGSRTSEMNSLTKSGGGLYVGHSTEGDVVVAANHYDAMAGLATTEADLGLTPRKDTDGQMLCAREMPTGSHVPRWICRYQDDVNAERQATRNWLDQPRLSFSNGLAPGGALGRGGGGGLRGTATP